MGDQWILTAIRPDRKKIFTATFHPGREKGCGDVIDRHQGEYNIFGADACHNIDRIMRLPGTINVPDPRKRKRGRVEALAKLVHMDNCALPITEFTAGPALQSGSELETFGAAPKVQLSGNVDRIEDVDELPDTVQDWCKALIVQGSNPGLVETHTQQISFAKRGSLRCRVPHGPSWLR